VNPGCATIAGDGTPFKHPRDTDSVVSWIEESCDQKAIRGRHPDGLNATTLGCCCTCSPCDSQRKAHIRARSRQNDAASPVQRQAGPPESALETPIAAASASSRAAGATVMRQAARAPDQHCEFCAAEKRATRLERVTLLPDEAWGAHGMAHALQISGRTQLGYVGRFVFDGDHYNLNNPCSAWFSDRLQQIATEHLQRLPSPYSVRGAPVICRHHKACYEQSEVGAAVSKLESELKHIEHRYIGSARASSMVG